MESRTEMQSETNEIADIGDWSDPGDEDADVMTELADQDGQDGNVRAGLAIASFAGLTLGAAALGRVANRRAPGLWYKMLRKPPFQPPSWLFGPVWTGLYALIATSGYRVWKAPLSKARTRALSLWGTQLALNAAWSPLFFGAHKKRAAFADLLALLGVVAAFTETARKVDKPAAAMMAPYLGWLGFAGVLNEELIRRNRGWRRWLG